MIFRKKCNSSWKTHAKNGKPNKMADDLRMKKVQLKQPLTKDQRLTNRIILQKDEGIFYKIT